MEISIPVNTIFILRRGLKRCNMRLFSRIHIILLVRTEWTRVTCTIYWSHGSVYFSVSLMTVIAMKEDFSTHMCPQLRLAHIDGMGNVTNDDRGAELLLMDNNINTCLTVFNQGQQFLRVAVYVYVLPSVTSVRVAIQVLNILCSDPEFIVYHKISASSQAGSHYKECARVDSPGSSNSVECIMICHNVHPVFNVASMIVQLENSSMRPEICEIDVQIFGTELESGA